MLIFEILIYLNKPSLGLCEVTNKTWDRSVHPFRRLLGTNKQTKHGTDQFTPLDVCWIQTNKQNRQKDKQSINIEY